MRNNGNLYVKYVEFDGLRCRYLKPFLLECPGRDVRTNFSALLEKSFAAHHTHSQKAKGT